MSDALEESRDVRAMEPGPPLPAPLRPSPPFLFHIIIILLFVMTAPGKWDTGKKGWRAGAIYAPNWSSSSNWRTFARGPVFSRL